ncbi:MAG: ferrous iron transport protein B [Candidatus Kryptoniota bacterium]
MRKKITVAVTGNPNVGKTTILNHAARTNLSVGNWPGVTVERKEGFTTYRGYEIHLVDLPGIYTLEPISEDEKIAHNFLSDGDPDVVLDVIETTNAERDLLLTLELLEFGKPMVIALNMIDEAERQGVIVNTAHMSEVLDIPVVKTNGKNGDGVDKLLDAIVDVYQNQRTPKLIKYNDKFEEALAQIRQQSNNGNINRHTLIDILSKSENGKTQRALLEKFYKKNIATIIKDERYSFANGFFAEVFKKKNSTARDITDRIDRVVLHPVYGFFIFLAAMFLLFKISFDFSNPLMDWIDGFINNFLSPAVSTVLMKAGATEWMLRFFSEAVVGGVGFVITFVPLIGTIYFLLALLEMSGYMPRIAFLMDRFMHKLGLHGKGMIPLLLGFGCNVPAIMATRTLENKRDKLLVIAMIPFMSCPARLIVFSFFAVLFFSNPAVVIFSLYMLGILVGLMTAFFLRKTAFKGRLSHFVMELPPYRAPSLTTVIRIVWAQIKNFLYRAGTLIFAASVVIWVLLNTPPGIKNPSQSFAAYIGKSITPVFKPIGIKDWRISTSLIPAFLAREIVLSSMGTIYSVNVDIEKKNFNVVDELERQTINLIVAVKESILSLIKPGISTLKTDTGNTNLRNVIKASFTRASALSFMIFLLLYTSCLATVAVMAREAGKWIAMAFLTYSFVIAWVVAFIVYNIGIAL